MTTTRVSFIDLYVLRQAPGGLECLVLRRSGSGRCPGSWEVVHGTIEPGELPIRAARRELEEETGLAIDRLYSLSRVETFYRHSVDEIALIPVFAALVSAGAAVRLGREHDRFEWLGLADAARRLAWPRERRALEDLAVLLAGGDAGVLEDVLRIAVP